MLGVAASQRACDQVSSPLIYASFPGHGDNPPRIAGGVVVRLNSVQANQIGRLETVNYLTSAPAPESSN